MKKYFFLTLVLAAGLLTGGNPATAQTKKKPVAKAKPAGTVSDLGFTKLKGIQYKFYKDAPGKTAEVGDMIEFHILLKCDTFTLGDSRAQMGGKPASMPFMEPHNSTDWQWILSKVSAGDSVVMHVACDSILKTIPKDNKQPLPGWLKKGRKIVINLAVVSIKPKEEVEKERAAQEKEQQAKSMEMIAAEDKTLQDYFTKNNLKPSKTASGLYYSIKQEGAGDLIASGKKLTMNYTGKLLDGTTFDSNIDSNFHHVSPFTFTVGAHMVIQGWDEGVQLLKKGSKATFYIPSPMAYGQRSPSPNIPPNSILMFDVEVVDVADK